MLAVAQPILGAEEKAALAEVIDSCWITMGDRVERFERAFAELHAMPNAVAVSSATAGLHLSLHALGLGAGDEVLVPSLTFVASANCVIYTGATPVLVDIQSVNRPLMSIEDAARKCTPRTKAIMLVHYAGYVADRDAWRSFAAERGLLIVEDAAHAAGLREAGTVGDAAVFSFYGNKNMTTAEGGMVVASDPKLLAAIRQLRGHGLTSGTFQRHRSAAPIYDATMLGFNYRMDELRAALGLVQLRKLPAWNARRRALTMQYRELLRGIEPDIEIPFGDLECSSFHIMPVTLSREVDRQALIEQMRSDGIQTSVHYPPVHQLSLYRQLCPGARLPVTEDFAARELTLPLHPQLELDDLRLIARSLQGALTNRLANP